MKKGLEKFVSILLFVLGVILIVFLTLAVFGELDDATMKNEVVRTMILGLAFVFLVCSAVMIAASFRDNDVLKAVVLSSERASTTRVSLSVIKKIVAKNAKYISGLKVSGVALQLDENNAIRMKLTVKISENDVDFVVDRFRCLLYDAFYATLGVEFASIDFKVKALSPKYAPDMNKVDRAAAEIKEKREKLMLQKLKMEEEEAKYEEERKLEAEKRRREEARLRREREEERKRERLQSEKEQFGNLGEAEEVPVYVIHDDFEMPSRIAENASEDADGGDMKEKKNAENVLYGQADSDIVENKPANTAEGTDEKSEEAVSDSPDISDGAQAEDADVKKEYADGADASEEARKEEIYEDSEAETSQSLDEIGREAYPKTEALERAGGYDGDTVGDGNVADGAEIDEGGKIKDNSEQTDAQTDTNVAESGARDADDDSAEASQKEDGDSAEANQKESDGDFHGKNEIPEIGKDEINKTEE